MVWLRMGEKRLHLGAKPHDGGAIVGVGGDLRLPPFRRRDARRDPPTSPHHRQGEVPRRHPHHPRQPLGRAGEGHAEPGADMIEDLSERPCSGAVVAAAGEVVGIGQDLVPGAEVEPTALDGGSRHVISSRVPPRQTRTCPETATKGPPTWGALIRRRSRNNRP